MPLSTRTAPRCALRLALVLGLAALAVPDTDAAASARGVRPAKGSYSWTSGAEPGRASEYVNLQVRGRKTVDFDSVGGLCGGVVPVFAILGGPERETRLRGTQVRKRVEVSQDGETAVLSVRLRWTRPALAVGSLRVRGEFGGARCDGRPTRITLERVTGPAA